MYRNRYNQGHNKNISLCFFNFWKAKRREKLKQIATIHYMYGSNVMFYYAKEIEIIMQLFFVNGVCVQK